ncbi:hypothetical protein PUR36_32250, partial [Klebsiella pneumoniae]|uniref:hypothetical protein n=1 Tax=Klebsiella pneumoniae TaxID=573 RepID=UPI0023F6539D
LVQMQQPSYLLLLHFSFNLHLILDIKPPYGGFFFVLIPSIILFIVYYTACGYSPEGSSLAR